MRSHWLHFVMGGLVAGTLILPSRDELSSALDSHLPSSSSSEEVLKAKTLFVSMAKPPTDSVVSIFSESEVLFSNEKVILLLLFNLEAR